MKGRFIVMAECANGNASVGTEWIHIEEKNNAAWAYGEK